MAAKVLLCISRSFQKTTSFTRPTSCFFTRGFAGQSNLPTPPKRPLTPYLAFWTDRFKEIKVNNPETTLIEQNKICSTMWKSLTEDEKRPFQLDFLGKLDEYKTEKSNFLNSLTPEQYAQMQKENKDKSKQRLARKKKQMVKKLNKPRRPPNSYSLYVKAEMVNRGVIKPMEYSHTLAKQWKEMTDMEKQPYVDEMKMRQAQYQKDLADWEREMIENGHPELVRGYRKPKAAKAKGKKKTKKGKKTVAKVSKGTQTDESWMREE